MPIPRAVRLFLKEHHVEYKTIYHTSTYTAQQLARAEHVSGEKVVKVVLLKTEEGYVLAALPACYKVDFSSLKKCCEKQELRLATEEEIRNLFPDCEIGAIPPFGDVYHLPLYVDESLTKQNEILISAGTHRDAIRLKYKDFEKWTHPHFGKIAVHL